MEFQEVFKAVQETDNFKEWKKEHENYFLAHAFVILDEPNKDIWQLGFYNQEKEKMATIIYDKGSISIVQDQEVLKGEGQIKPLVPEEVKLKVAEALEKAKEVMDEHYKGRGITKTFFIIQHIENNSVFNITHLTMGFETINIKVSTIDGKIVKHTAKKTSRIRLIL